MNTPFYFNEGRTANNISELREVLQTLSTEQISKYINTEKNDFANWIEHSLNDKQFAVTLRTVSTSSNVKSLLDQAMGYSYNAPHEAADPGSGGISSEQDNGESNQGEGNQVESNLGENKMNASTIFKAGNSDYTGYNWREQEILEDQEVLMSDPGLLTPHQIYPTIPGGTMDEPKDEEPHDDDELDDYKPPGSQSEEESFEESRINERKREDDKLEKSAKKIPPAPAKNNNDRIYKEHEAAASFKPINKFPSLKVIVITAVLVIVAFIIGFMLRGMFVQ